LERALEVKKLGRIRQKYIKRASLEVIRNHREKLSQDFQENRKVLDAVLLAHGKFVRNKIAGYITHRMTMKKR